MKVRQLLENSEWDNTKDEKHPELTDSQFQADALVHEIRIQELRLRGLERKYPNQVYQLYSNQMPPSNLVKNLDQFDHIPLKTNDTNLEFDMYVDKLLPKVIEYCNKTIRRMKDSYDVVYAHYKRSHDRDRDRNKQ